MANQKASKRVTLHDIARQTGYSVTAVSRALRGMSDIGPDATANIKKTAEELGYVANQTAVALRYGKTNVITAILVSLTNPFFSSMANLIQIAAQKMGYSLIIVCSQDVEGLEMKLVEEAIARRSDGVLLFPTNHSARSIERLQAAHVPFVLLSRNFQPYQTDCVVIDDEKGAMLSTAHLIEAGCRKLAFLASSNDSPSYLPRQNGFTRACIDAGIPSEDQYACTLPELKTVYASHGTQMSTIIQQLSLLMNSGIDGLFVFCDVEAWIVMDAIKRSPELSAYGFKISSFDNISGALMVPTPLCSVDCGMDEIAQKGMEVLRDRINGDDQPPRTIVCQVRMVCRDSCGKH